MSHCVCVKFWNDISVFRKYFDSGVHALSNRNYSFDIFNIHYFQDIFFVLGFENMFDPKEFFFPRWFWLFSFWIKFESHNFLIHGSSYENSFSTFRNCDTWWIIIFTFMIKTLQPSRFLNFIFKSKNSKNLILITNCQKFVICG